MIQTQNLTKHYHGLVAVDDLTFSVEPGEVLGFLGPNGAGKSTTMRMIAGFVAPTGGSGQHLRPRHRHRSPSPPRRRWAIYPRARRATAR